VVLAKVRPHNQATDYKFTAYSLIPNGMYRRSFFVLTKNRNTLVCQPLAASHIADGVEEYSRQHQVTGQKNNRLWQG